MDANILSEQYFRKNDTLTIAKDLLGKILETRFDGLITSGRIVETEAYLGIEDKASHAYGGKRTTRTDAMYLPAGHAYVYLCYGIHHLFNIVTQEKDIPHAILIRALEPMEGIEHMLARRNKQQLDFSLTRGPGSLSQALGIHYRQSGLLLQPPNTCIRDDGTRIPVSRIAETPRIGVDYAGEDARLPYRFSVKNNLYVSGKKLKT